MNFIFPLIYSISTFTLLIFLAFYVFGQVRLTQKVEKKINSLQKRLKNKPTSYEDHYKLGQLFLRKKLYNKAIVCFRKSLLYWNPNDKIGLGSLYNTLGFTYFTLKNYKYAIYYYKQAVVLLSDYLLALNNLGFTYEKIQDYEKAYQTYNLILVFNPENKNIKLRLSYIEAKRKLRLGRNQS